MSQFSPIKLFESYVRGVRFWSRKVFDGVHSHVMDLLQKSDFGPFNFSSKFMITCSNPIWIQILTSNRNWTKIGNSNNGPKSDLDK